MTSKLLVRTLSGSARQGVLEFGPFRWRCALGRSGLSAVKREGDGASPRGRFTILAAHYRPDRLRRPTTALPLKALRADAGWCDAPGDRNYNRPVRLPYAASAETLWRQDGLYDIVLVLDYNVTPRRRGRGSAIFLHVARDGYAPTEGCVALAKRDLALLLAHLPPRATLMIA